MNIMLGPDAEKFIEQKLKTGHYASAEDVVLAGLQALARTPEDQFEPGELDALIAEGERSIECEGTIDADELFRQLRQKNADQRSRGG